MIVKNIFNKRLLLVLFALAVVTILLAGILFYQSVRVIEIVLPATPADNSPGALFQAEQVGKFGAVPFRMLLWWAGLPEKVTVHCGARLYRLHYWTKRFDDASVAASGLLAVPIQTLPLGVVSYHHGTNIDRHAAPSRPSLAEGVLGAAVFAGGRYLFAAPDYIGLGASQEVHTYLNAENTSSTVVDFLQAARSFTASQGIPWPDKILLTGFSQGGHATLAVQRTLETLNSPSLRVVAVAPVSGAYDLEKISFPTALAGASGAHSLYLGYLVNAYCTVYGQPLESVLTPHYAQIVPVLFDGEGDYERMERELPKDPRDMFNEEFLDNYERGDPTWLLDALRNNSVLNWTPKAPLRVYFGENDVDVSPEEARAAVTAFSQRGSDVTLVSVGVCGHDESILRAVPGIRDWFDEVSSHSGS